MVYAKAFFDLQLLFAHRVADVSCLPLTRALLEYTNLYVRFGLGREFDPADETWQTYLAGLRDTSDWQEWTYRFYVTRAHQNAAPTTVATFGCFSYALLDGDRIRLHFQNTGMDKHSSLGLAYREQRQAELIDLFAHVKQSLHDGVQVVGASWLYNLDAYRRLFPVSYVATARVIGDRFQSMPLWGQFLDRHGALKEASTRPFLQRLAQQSSLVRLNECFPFQVLSPQAPVLEFYDFYGIS